MKMSQKLPVGHVVVNFKYSDMFTLVLVLKTIIFPYFLKLAKIVFSEPLPTFVWHPCASSDPKKYKTHGGGAHTEYFPGTWSFPCPTRCTRTRWRTARSGPRCRSRGSTRRHWPGGREGAEGDYGLIAVILNAWLLAQTFERKLSSPLHALF